MQKSEGQPQVVEEVEVTVVAVCVVLVVVVVSVLLVVEVVDDVVVVVAYDMLEQMGALAPMATPMCRGSSATQTSPSRTKQPPGTRSSPS
mmetsp:Transcript_1879/g.5699  ORF Transcript_1879/g.5699 Transcript_1879/m.5699 type:complete len:90 (+) Transcript_1879:240-509(+)